MPVQALNARNQFSGRVTSIIEAPVLSEVEVELPSGLRITATLSTRDISDLRLAVGGSVIAFVKSNDVSIALV